MSPITLILLVLILALFFGGFALDVLFWVAAVLLVLWLLGWVVRPGGRRWYYW